MSGDGEWFWKTILVREVLRWLDLGSILCLGQACKSLRDVAKECLLNNYYYNVPVDQIQREDPKRVRKLICVDKVECDYSQYVNATHMWIALRDAKELSTLRALTHLTIDRISGSLKGLPTSLTHLRFTRFQEFNESLDCLPPYLVELHLGENFDQPLDRLPQTLRSLTVGSAFSHSLKNLPPGLVQLSVSMWHEYYYTFGVYTATADEIAAFPRGIKRLFLNCRFPVNLDLTSGLPPNLEELALNCFDNPTLSFPKTLRRLTLTYYGKRYVEALPPNLKHFFIYVNPNVEFGGLSPLPSGLVYLEVRSWLFNDRIDGLPESLETLMISSNAFNQPVDALPRNLKVLKLEDCPTFNRTVDNLPMGLETLTLSRSFDQSLDNLPGNLKCLKIYGGFNRSLDRLPPSLETLCLYNTYLNGPSFNQPLNSLPPNLKSLTLYTLFNKPVDRLPNGLKELELGYGFNQSIDRLPDTVRRISIDQAFDRPIKRFPRDIEQFTTCGVFEVSNLPPNLPGKVYSNRTTSYTDYTYTNYTVCKHAKPNFISWICDPSLWHSQ